MCSAPHGQFSERVCEQVVQASVPQVTGQFVARLADVPMPQILKENVEMLNLTPHDQMFERSGNQIVHVPFPPAARFVTVPVFRILKDNVEVASKFLRDLVHRLWRPQFHTLQSRAAHFFCASASACVSVKLLAQDTPASPSEASRDALCCSVRASAHQGWAGM